MVKEKKNLYLLAIVAIVAIVGIVVLVLNSGAVSVEGDLAGAALVGTKTSISTRLIYYSDKDNDGLSYWEETTRYNTDPTSPDTDGDSLSDGEEVNRYKTDPLDVDTDNDGIDDGLEIRSETDPLNSNSP